MDINTRDHPVTQKPYTLPLKQIQRVNNVLEMLEKNGVPSQSVFPWSSPNVTVSKKAQLGAISQEQLCID